MKYQRFGRPGEVSLACNRDKIPQITKFHIKNVSNSMDSILELSAESGQHLFNLYK
ncbi:Uncharacterised protein [Enterobacter cloacae]|uniref:Uncharacterized protein n=1 Tax=Enterobacter cloacae TaxID=550 RepID=A0A377M5Z8_ENTCL|nr:Uncharacterised protein [Enterobacter cloacae]